VCNTTRAEEVVSACENGGGSAIQITGAENQISNVSAGYPHRPTITRTGYGCARTFAQLLGLDEVADLLQETLDEEGNADKKLTELAETAINVEASAAEE